MTLPQAERLGPETIHPPKARVFTDRDKLNEMLDLAKTGMSKTDLGDMFGVDRTTIYFHLKKYGVIVPKTSPPDKSGLKIQRKSTANSPIVKTEVPNVDEYGSPINEGHLYKVYAEKDKRERQAEFELHLPRRIAEENRKNKFCEDVNEVLVRQTW